VEAISAEEAINWASFTSSWESWVLRALISGNRRFTGWQQQEWQGQELLPLVYYRFFLQMYRKAKSKRETSVGGQCLQLAKWLALNTLGCAQARSLRWQGQVIEISLLTARILTFEGHQAPAVRLSRSSRGATWSSIQGDGGLSLTWHKRHWLLRPKPPRKFKKPGVDSPEPRQNEEEKRTLKDSAKFFLNLTSL
jgi:hypothetical protein